MKKYKNRIAIPLEVVKAQTKQLLEYIKESQLGVEDIRIQDLDLIFYSNSNKNTIAYFKHLMNRHIDNINMLEKITSGK